MRHRSLILGSALTIALTAAACTRNSAPTAIPTLVLSGGQGGPPSGTSGGVSASGEVVPEPRAQLSFPLTGTVTTVDVQPGDPVTEGQLLLTLEPAIWEARVQEAEGTLAAAKAQEALLVRQGADQEHIDAANADVDTAQAALEAARATLTQAALTAPFAGTVASVSIAVGETVTPGQIVVLLGDLSNFQVVTTDLGERDVPLVELGQRATIAVNAVGEDYTGHVLDIARVSTTLGGDVVYEVTLAFDEQPQDLMWGMTAEIRIETTE